MERGPRSGVRARAQRERKERSQEEKAKAAASFDRVLCFLRVQLAGGVNEAESLILTRRVHNAIRNLRMKNRTTVRIFASYGRLHLDNDLPEGIEQQKHFFDFKSGVTVNYIITHVIKDPISGKGGREVPADLPLLTKLELFAARENLITYIKARYTQCLN